MDPTLNKMTAWIPLESNPEVLSDYLQKIGVDTTKWNIVDIYSLDLLDYVPKPVKAVILLFPCSEKYETHRMQQDEELKAMNVTCPEGLFFTKQNIHNACGTIALIHAILNNPDIQLREGVLRDFFEKTKSMSPEERANVLEGDCSFTDAHQDMAQEGQTMVPGNDEKVIHHFVTFVNFKNELFEMDGRKSFPIKHGPTSEDSILEDAAKVCKDFMARDPEEVRFTVLGLTAVET